MKKILAAVWFMLLGAGGLYAAGTVSGTQVTNVVALTYTVGGVSQTQIDANDTDGFLVDKIVDFTLAHDDTPRHLVVAPGATDQVRQFTLTNTGNAVQDFNLLATNLTGSEVLDSKTDTKDALNFEYSLDNSIWNSTPPVIDDLAIDTNVTIYVRSDIPAAPAAVNGDIINIQLEATAVQDGTATIEAATSGADTQGSVDTVLGEGIGVTTEGNALTPDAKFSAWAGYEVQSASLTATKSSCIISDPVNGTTNPKRIPGAVLRYQIEIENTGTSTATGVSIVDTISSEFDNSAANLEVWTGACPAIASGVCDTKIGTLESNTHTGAGTNSVTLDYADIAAGVTNCGYIQVTIQ